MSDSTELKEVLNQRDNENADFREELLEAIWLEVGPYNHEPLSEETMQRLQSFFNFDDLE